MSGAECPKCHQPAMTPGQRYERTQTVDVAICWQCGWETPPLGSCCKRERDWTGVTAACVACNAPLPARYVREGLQHCSRACRYPSPNQTVTRPCAHCVKPFSAPLWSVKQSRSRFCSKSCAALDSNRLRRERSEARRGAA